DDARGRAVLSALRVPQLATFRSVTGDLGIGWRDGDGVAGDADVCRFAGEVLLDVLQVGRQRFRMGVAQHREITGAVRAELEHLGSLLAVLLDFAPVGRVDNKLMRPGVAGTKEAVKRA